MKKMAALIQNEHMKFYSRPSPWIILGLIVISIALIAISSLNDPSMTSHQMIEVGTVLDTLLVVIVVVYATRVISEEFYQRTIDLLLVRPVKRWKILFAKYLVVMLFSLFLYAVLFLSSSGMGFALFSNEASPELNLLQPMQEPLSFLDYVWVYLALWIKALFYGTIAVMLSTLLGSRAFSISITLILMIGNDILLNVLYGLTGSIALAKYLYFIHVDLTPYLKGEGFNEMLNLSLPLSMVILGAYFVLFYLCTWYSFTRKDIH